MDKSIPLMRSFLNKNPTFPLRKDKLMVQKAMRMTAIEHLGDKNMLELSGGQRQKVYIAMVLAQNTDILFFDEPTTFLDLNHQFEIMEMIYGLKKIGKTVLSW
jgi:ABC-type cobalamin/Fe3+-siderophores transport system ATPase subunit